MIFKYLSLIACAGKAPIRQKMLNETLNRVFTAGEIENIERWCLWTPTQLSLLELADKLRRVILIGGNGTGKTVMLDGFAIKMAKERPEEPVIFGIHQHRFKNARPLLHLDLEVKYEKMNINNISVKKFEASSELRVAWNNTNATICLDEINIESRSIVSNIFF